MKVPITEIIVLLFLSTVPLWADYSPREWLNSPSGAPYQSVADELEMIFSEAEARHIPGDILVDKMKEGSAKRVSGSQMVQALRAEMERLTLAMQLLNKPDRTSSESRDTLLKAISLLLQGGVPVDTIDAVLEYSSLVNQSSSRAIYALSSAFRVIAIAQAPAELLRPLSECLVRSSLQERQFSQLQSLAVRAKSQQIQGERLIQLIIGSLDSGGGLPALDRELQKRSKLP